MTGKKRTDNNDNQCFSSTEIADAWKQLKKEFEAVLKSQNYSAIYNSEAVEAIMSQQLEKNSPDNNENSSQPLPFLGFSEIQRKIFSSISAISASKDGEGVENIPSEELFSLSVLPHMPFDETLLSKFENIIFSHQASRSFEKMGLNLQKQAYDGVSSLNEFYSNYNLLCTILYNTVPKAVSIFDGRFSEYAEYNDEITIIKFYKIWLNSCEQAYLQVTSTDEYAKAYGSVINTFIRLKNQTSEFTNTVSSAIGLPTQKEVDEAQKGQHELHEQHASIKDDLCNVLHKQKIDESAMRSKMNAMEGEIDSLKEQIESLKKLIQNPHEQKPEQNIPNKDDSDIFH